MSFYFPFPFKILFHGFAVNKKRKKWGKKGSDEVATQKMLRRTFKKTQTTLNYNLRAIQK